MEARMRLLLALGFLGRESGLAKLEFVATCALALASVLRENTLAWQYRGANGQTLQRTAAQIAVSVLA